MRSSSRLLLLPLLVVEYLRIGGERDIGCGVTMRVKLGIF